MISSFKFFLISSSWSLIYSGLSSISLSITKYLNSPSPLSYSMSINTSYNLGIFVLIPCILRRCFKFVTHNASSFCCSIRFDLYAPSVVLNSSIMFFQFLMISSICPFFLILDFKVTFFVLFLFQIWHTFYTLLNFHSDPALNHIIVVCSSLGLLAIDFSSCSVVLYFGSYWNFFSAHPWQSISI